MVFGLEQRRIFGTNKLLDKYTVYHKPQDFGPVHKDEVPIQCYITRVNDVDEFMDLGKHAHARKIFTTFLLKCKTFLQGPVFYFKMIRLKDKIQIIVDGSN